MCRDKSFDNNKMWIWKGTHSTTKFAEQSQVPPSAVNNFNKSELDILEEREQLDMDEQVMTLIHTHL